MHPRTAGQVAARASAHGAASAAARVTSSSNSHGWFCSYEQVLHTAIVTVAERTQHGMKVLRSSKTGLLLLALVVGAGAGVGAIAFRWLIKTFTLVLSGHEDYSARRLRQPARALGSGAGSSSAPPSWPACSTARSCTCFAREARGHGVPEVMYRRRAPRRADRPAGRRGQGPRLRAVHRRRRFGRPRGADRADRLRARVDPRSVWSASPSTRMRVLVACGAAGGIAATFNAPLAGRVLRDGADPVGLRRAVLRHGRPRLGHGQRDRPRRPRQRPVPGPAGLLGPPRSGVPALRRARPARRARRRALHPRALRDRGRVRLGVARPRVAAPGRRRTAARRPAAGRCPQMYGVGYPVLGEASPAATPSASCCSSWSARWSRPA